MNSALSNGKMAFSEIGSLEPAPAGFKCFLPLCQDDVRRSDLPPPRSSHPLITEPATVGGLRRCGEREEQARREFVAAFA